MKKQGRLKYTCRITTPKVKTWKSTKNINYMKYSREVAKIHPWTPWSRTRYDFSILNSIQNLKSGSKWTRGKSITLIKNACKVKNKRGVLVKGIGDVSSPGEIELVEPPQHPLELSPSNHRQRTQSQTGCRHPIASREDCLPRARSSSSLVPPMS